MPGRSYAWHDHRYQNAQRTMGRLIHGRSEGGKSEHNRQERLAGIWRARQPGAPWPASTTNWVTQSPQRRRASSGAAVRQPACSLPRERATLKRCSVFSDERLGRDDRRNTHAHSVVSPLWPCSDAPVAAHRRRRAQQSNDNMPLSLALPLSLFFLSLSKSWSRCRGAW